MTQIIVGRPPITCIFIGIILMTLILIGLEVSIFTLNNFRFFILGMLFMSLIIQIILYFKQDANCVLPVQESEK